MCFSCLSGINEVSQFWMQYISALGITADHLSEEENHFGQSLSQMHEYIAKAVENPLEEDIVEAVSFSFFTFMEDLH